MAQSSSPQRDAGGVRVVVVAHGPPVRGGVATVALDIIEDPELGREFELVFQNTAQNDDQRGELALENITRAFTDAWTTFRLARRGAIVHTHAAQHPVFPAWRQVAIAAGGRLRGARVLAHDHAQPPYMELPGEYRISRGHRWAFRVLDLLVDANILIAEAGVPNIRQYMPKADLPVVYNSVVVDEIVQTAAVHEPPVILFVGELLERKGVRDLLDALDLLEARDVRDWELRIVGDNRPGLEPLKDEMIELIRERGHEAAMTGPLDRSDVYRHLSEADIYVFPTYIEGQPFTVIESLAAGVPIVATDILAIANMMDDGENGRLVSAGDVPALADAMEELLADPDRRRKISEANRSLAREKFDRATFRRRLAELYRKYARP
jgi:glycosyltransferase involved in cell wall biosynthesis